MTSSNKTILALDPGTRFLGLAISREGQLAEPFGEFDLKHSKQANLITLIKQINPDEIIIGQPSFGPIHAEAISLQAMLSEFVSAPISFFSEDETTIRSKRHLSQTKSKQSDHSLAAAFILQAYLER